MGDSRQAHNARAYSIAATGSDVVVVCCLLYVTREHG